MTDFWMAVIAALFATNAITLLMLAGLYRHNERLAENNANLRGIIRKMEGR